MLHTTELTALLPLLARRTTAGGVLPGVFAEWSEACNDQSNNTSAEGGGGGGRAAVVLDPCDVRMRWDAEGALTCWRQCHADRTVFLHRSSQLRPGCWHQVQVALRMDGVVAAWVDGQPVHASRARDCGQNFSEDYGAQLCCFAKSDAGIVEEAPATVSLGGFVVALVDACEPADTPLGAAARPQGQQQQHGQQQGLQQQPASIETSGDVEILSPALCWMCERTTCRELLSPPLRSSSSSSLLNKECSQSSSSPLR